MFDIGFWELALIGVVALLVVGPDRLPALARTVGLWVGRIRRYVSTVREDIEAEIQADELKKILEKPSDLNALQDIVDETTSTISDARKEIADVEKETGNSMSDESPVAPEPADKLGVDDNATAADEVTPAAAATTVGEAVGAHIELPAQTSTETSSETSNEGVENTQNNGQRAR